MTSDGAQAHERIAAAVKYAVAVLGNHRDVAAPFHRPIIQGYMDELNQLTAQAERIVQLEAERDALLKEVGRPRCGRICPQDGGVCWEKQCGVRFCEIEALESALAQAIQALREIERHCPCGARPESPRTHPHVTGCLVAAALSASPHENSKKTRRMVNCDIEDDPAYQGDI